MFFADKVNISVLSDLHSLCWLKQVRVKFNYFFRSVWSLVLPPFNFNIFTKFLRFFLFSYQTFFFFLIFGLIYS